MDFLSLERDAGIAVLTIERPERRNALHGPLWTAIRDMGRTLASDPPRALIVRGRGDHFCAGMDLRPDNPLLARLGPAMATADKVEVRKIIVELKGTMDAIATIPCPVIAAIEGACVGGGVELALSCDLRVASYNAFFSMPEARLGMVPDVGGCVRLTRAIGRAHATDLILTGRKIDAKLAFQWGLVDRLCATGDAFADARALALDIAKGAPTANREALLAIRAADALPAAEAFERETEHGATAVVTGELLEGVAAFAQKREPSW